MTHVELPWVAVAEPGSADALIWHSSDNRITPIVGNARIERLAQPKFDPHTLPVPAWVRPPLTSLRPLLNAIERVLAMVRA